MKRTIWKPKKLFGASGHAASVDEDKKPRSKGRWGHSASITTPTSSSPPPGQTNLKSLSSNQILANDEKKKGGG